MPRPLGLRNLRHVAACAALVLAFRPSRGAATELPGTRLEVVRGTGADACPDAEQLSTELSERMTLSFPSGILLQEREALTISALAATGRREEASARARAFLRAFPNSPHAERVRGAIGER